MGGIKNSGWDSHRPQPVHILFWCLQAILLNSYTIKKEGASTGIFSGILMKKLITHTILTKRLFCYDVIKMK